MNRRLFFKNGGLVSIGALLPKFFVDETYNNSVSIVNKGKKAKNIIMLVSDGMSSGTLNMADIYLSRKTGNGSLWLNLYRENKITRGLMDMASASSIVTDSAAASSSWGSGFRVKNGSLNIGVNNEEYLPIWQKFKRHGKSAGCVTTVPITHATPAGFCVSNKSRNSQPEIALQYLEQGFEVLLGGGQKYFDASKREDKKDVYQLYKEKNYQVVTTKEELNKSDTTKKILGVFDDDALPYSVDYNNSDSLKKNIPTLAEMTQKAISILNQNPNGFVLQVEAGKVDWAAHANDIAGLLFDQIAFDETIKVALDFAEKDKETLIIITTDHGNANPGIIYGSKANSNFDSIEKYKTSNESLLNSFSANTSTSDWKEIVNDKLGITLLDDDIAFLKKYYEGLKKEDDGLYNYRNLPYKTFAEIQKKYNSIGWISMDHSADYTEIAMFGPGSEKLKPFIKNTDLHYFMLEATEVQNKF